MLSTRFSLFLPHRSSSPPAYAKNIYQLSPRRQFGLDRGLFDRLTNRFGKQPVFRDLDTIPLGAPFATVIAEQIARCEVLLAVIGKQWLEPKSADGRRRLDDPADLVKHEIAAALAQHKLVIPCLVDGATMPKTAELPPEIAALATRNALAISEMHFDHDIGRLLAAIGPQPIEAQTVRPRPGKVKLLCYSAAATFIATLLFLVVAEIAWGWRFGPPEISLITLMILGVIVFPKCHRARRRGCPGRAVGFATMASNYQTYRKRLKSCESIFCCCLSY